MVPDRVRTTRILPHDVVIAIGHMPCRARAVPMSGVTRFMSSGWRQDQQDLRWPDAPRDDAWPPRGDAGDGAPGSYGPGRDSPDPWAAGQGFGDPWSAGQEPAGSLDVGRGGAGAGQTAGRDADGRTGGRLRPRGRAAPTPPSARQDRQPEPGVAGDEEYDWYRYLSHGGSAPSQGAAEADAAGRAAGYAAPRDDRPGPAPRTARKKNRDERKDRDEGKNREERKPRRDRKRRGADDGPLTERRPRSGADGPADPASGWGEDQAAADAGPAGTGPGRGWQAYQGPATAQLRAGYADPASTSPGHGRRAFPDAAAPPRPAYPDPAADPASTSPGHGRRAFPGAAAAQPGAYPDPAAGSGGTGPGQGWRAQPAAAAHPGLGYAAPADTGPGRGWQPHPGAAAAQPGYTDAGYGQPPYPGPAMPRPVPAGPDDQPGSGRHPGMHPAGQPYAPAGDGPAGSVAVDNSAPARPARRSAKRVKKALRSPSARAVRQG